MPSVRESGTAVLIAFIAGSIFTLSPYRESESISEISSVRCIISPGANWSMSSFKWVPENLSGVAAMALR